MLTRRWNRLEVHRRCEFKVGRLMTFLMPGIRKFQRLGAEGFRNVCFEEWGLQTIGRILQKSMRYQSGRQRSSWRVAGIRGADGSGGKSSRVLDELKLVKGFKWNTKEDRVKWSKLEAAKHVPRMVGVSCRTILQSTRFEHFSMHHNILIQCIQYEHARQYTPLH